MQGEEKINGYRCQKYWLKNMDDSNTDVTQWFSKELDVSIKTEMVNRSTDEVLVIEYNNIQEKTIPVAQFEIPAGFQKFGMPAIPNMLGGQFSAPSGVDPNKHQ